MPTVNFSAYQSVKQAFDATVAGQNKGAIMVELIDNALALLCKPPPKPAFNACSQRTFWPSWRPCWPG